MVGSSADKPVMGPMADVIVAANTASEIALRMMKPGGENTLVSDTVQKVAREFGCTPVEGEPAGVHQGKVPGSGRSPRVWGSGSIRAWEWHCFALSVYLCESVPSQPDTLMHV